MPIAKAIRRAARRQDGYIDGVSVHTFGLIAEAEKQERPHIQRLVAHCRYNGIKARNAKKARKAARKQPSQTPEWRRRPEPGKLLAYP